jgi:hypothetical protein
LERIPWASAHPKDVKKGTFIGEMSRLATLSSTLAGYEDAMQHLKMIYIARGYPPDLINSWLKDNVHKRWRNRHGKSEREGDVFVLKSHFNPVWNAFNIHELGRVVIDRWVNFLETQDYNNQLLGITGPALSEPTSLLKSTGTLGGPGGGFAQPADLSWNSAEGPVVGLVATSDFPADPEKGLSAAGPLIAIPKPIGFGGKHIEERKALDIRKLGYHTRKWLVSRKRNFNLFDLTSKLKQHVLYLSTDPDVIMDGSVDTWD